jgi:hypothetical protein
MLETVGVYTLEEALEREGKCRRLPTRTNVLLAGIYVDCF